MNGYRSKSFNLYTVIFIFAFLSCKSPKNYFIKDNYNYSVLLFNKNLGISSQFFGDMKTIDSCLITKKKINKKIKNIPELHNKKIFAYLETTSEPDYEAIYFYDEIKNAKDTITKTELILNDKKNNRIVYKKSKLNKVIYLYLKPKKANNHDYLTDSQLLIKEVTFDNEKLNKTTYQDVFFGIKDWSNYLLSRKVLKTKLLTQTTEQKWNQYQFLTTINSFISNNVEYDSLIAKNTTRFQPVIDSLQKIIKFDNKLSVLEKIKQITKDEKVVMLNEKHWCPNHRLLAYEMLSVLKENNFKYLAIEGVENQQDSLINLRGFPSKNSGYYTREPYFAHFIRKAKSLGFTIVSYDDMVSINREQSQAQNLKKIIDNDADAKIFVYAGVDHILESNSSYKWMAEYFMQLTKINPITFSQDKVVGKTSEEIVLIPSSLLKNVERLNTNVDYFIINNLKPTLNDIYPAREMKGCKIINKKFRFKNLLIRVYIKSEYDLLSKNSIPIYITNILSGTKELNLLLPTGNFFVSVISDKNEILFDDYIIEK